MKRLGSIFILILCIACGNLEEGVKIQNDVSNSVLFSKVWRLYAYESGAVNQPTTLSFNTEKKDRGILSGKCGVNFYEATFELSGDNTIKILGLSTTEIVSSSLDLGFEQNFYQRINTVKTYSIENNMLILKTVDGRKLYFK